MILGYVRMVLPQRIFLDAGFSLRLMAQVAVDCWGSFAGLSFLLKRTNATNQGNKKTKQKKTSIRSFVAFSISSIPLPLFEFLLFTVSMICNQTNKTMKKVIRK